MASSENLATIQPWDFRSAFSESWISQSLSRDSETLTRALQKSLSDSPDCFSHGEISPNSSVCLENPLKNRRDAAGHGGVVGKKITKRKSRASKRETTTFIVADVESFRRMVQQVTGVGFEKGQVPRVAPAPAQLKSEPQRKGFGGSQGCLPTLDTSAFLLEHHRQRSSPAVTGTDSCVLPPPAVGDGGLGFDWASLSSFPTLESWS